MPKPKHIRPDEKVGLKITVAQRKLICDKLAAEKAPELKKWSGYFPAETKIATTTESGDTAEAVLRHAAPLAF